jgi:hypothetical protein
LDVSPLGKTLGVTVILCSVTVEAHEMASVIVK